MKRETILKGIRLRSIFDSFSHEFNSSTIEDKLLILALLNRYGYVDFTIKEYIKDYKEKNRNDVVDEINNTLSFFVTILNPEISFDNYGNNKIKLNKVIPILKDELRKYSNKNFSFDRFVVSYLKKDTEEYNFQKKFFKIDLDNDIIDRVKERDLEENKPFPEQYFHLLKFLQYNLIPDYLKKDFKGYKVDAGFDYQSEYIVRYFLQNPTEKNYLEAIKYAIDVLYFESCPFHKFVLFRNNFGDKQQIQKFYDSDETAIYLDTELDFEDWHRIENNKKPKQQYLQRWKVLTESVADEDVVILASYKGIGFKIGKIKKGTGFTKFSVKKSTYYIYKLEDAIKVDLDLFLFVQTILPSNVTLSNIYRKNQSLRKIYPGVVCKTRDFENDDKAFEILVAEWLRSKYAPKEYRIKYQILKTGGNKKDIDIFGVTEDNKKLIVQVSNTENRTTIKQKIEKLEKYKEFDKLFFFNIPDEKAKGYNIISINKVLQDFQDDEYYKPLLEELS